MFGDRFKLMLVLSEDLIDIPESHGDALVEFCFGDSLAVLTKVE